MPRYYTFGGQPIQYAGQWNGFPSRLSRVAAETRGLSGHDGIGKDPEVEYLPWRPSGPEALDPGEGGRPFGLFENLSDNERRFGAIALIAAVGWYLWKSSEKKKNRKVDQRWVALKASGRSVLDFDDESTTASRRKNPGRRRRRRQRPMPQRTLTKQWVLEKKSGARWIPLYSSSNKRDVLKDLRFEKALVAPHGKYRVRKTQRDNL